MIKFLWKIENRGEISHQVVEFRLETLTNVLHESVGDTWLSLSWFVIATEHNLLTDGAKKINDDASSI